MKMLDIARRLVTGEEGATAVEYAMIIGLIALATFAVYRAVGEKVFSIMEQMNIHLGNATKTYSPS